MHVVFIYVTVPGQAEAQEMAQAVVRDRLAACANIIPGMKSVFHWKGEMQVADEHVILFKTRAELAPAVEARVKELHSYETPCIVVLPIAAGSAPYLTWVLEETKP